MRFLDNQSIRKKLILGFIAVIFLSALGMFISFKGSDAINNRLNTLVEKDIQIVINNLKIRRALTQMRMYEVTILLAATTDDERKNDYLLIQQAQEEAISRLDHIENLMPDIALLQVTRDVNDKFKIYAANVSEVVKLVQKGDMQEALKLSQNKGRIVYEEMFDIAAEVTAIQEKAFQAAKDDTDIIFDEQFNLMLIISFLIIITSIFIAWFISKSLVGRVRQLIKITESISKGDLHTKNTLEGRDEISQLAHAINEMQNTLQIDHVKIETHNWIESGLARTNSTILGETSVNSLATKVIAEVAEYIGAKVGALYVLKEVNDEPVLSMLGSYAYTGHKDLPTQFKYGEGLIGQVALSHKQIIIKKVPENYFRVVSGLGEISPRSICLTPIIFEEKLIGVLEIGTLEFLTNIELEYLNQVVEIIAVAFAITSAQEKMIQQQNELIRANEKLTELDLMKTNFLSTVSHELRTPLTSVIGFASIMQKKFETVLYPALSENEDKKVQKAIRQVMDNTAIIVEEGQRLTTLINDVLDLAKMEAGRVDWNIAELSIEDIIDRGISSTSSLLANKPVKMCKDIADNLPLCLGDRDRLIQVVINLISNAIKFTDEGKVILKARAKGDELVVSVIDSGSGIKPEDQPLVFEKFKQVGDTMTDKPQGTGLGLPICKEIIEHLGGQLWVESEIGVGSIFMFSLPVSLQKHDTRATTQKDRDENKSIVTTADGDEISIIWHTTSESLEKALRLSLEAVIVKGENAPNILVIDDNINIRKFLHQELSAVGYDVREASSGAQGLAMIAEKKPDLIVLDVKMPHLNGFEVAVRLHTNPITLAIPVIFHTIAEDKLLSEQLGVECYLTKPVKDTDLLAAVKKFLKIPTTRKKILLFIEDLDKRRTWVSLLECCGFEVSAVESVVQGIDSAVAFSPDLVIAEASLAKQYKIIQQLRVELGLERTLFTLVDDGVFN